VPLSRNRKAIVSLMTASAAIPQFGIDAEADLTELIALRGDGADFSVGDAVLRASALCLRAHPELNASFDAEAVVRHANVNLGLGIIGPEGLMVVVLRDADRLSISEIATERRRLISAADRGELRGDEVLGATFVISNLGPAGVVRFQALLVPPAAAILAVGKVQDRVRLTNTGIDGFSALTVCLSCDHRVVDGFEAALFLETFTTLLGQPTRLLAGN
jgi:pyruvate dehydrogenase E2 component (dihydrolipoyllysine-residue acetyltransferase)